MQNIWLSWAWSSSLVALSRAGQLQTHVSFTQGCQNHRHMCRSHCWLGGLDGVGQAIYIFFFLNMPGEFAVWWTKAKLGGGGGLLSNCPWGVCEEKCDSCKLFWGKQRVHQQRSQSCGLSWVRLLGLRAFFFYRQRISCRELWSEARIPTRNQETGAAMSLK